MACEHFLLVCSKASNHMPARTSPENGDVLVRQETRDGTVVYILRTASGTDQYLLRTREDAVVQALTFAERQGVRAWLIDDTDHCVPLSNGRTGKSIGVKRERPMPGGLRLAGGEREREVVMPHTPLVKRIRGEYLEMPGLRLTLEQAQRLCGVERMLCKIVLDALVEAQFLCVKPNGTYARTIDGQDVPRPRSAKADRGAGARGVMAS